MTPTLRQYTQKAAIWSIGFILTGYVCHGLDWHDYRDAGSKTILTSLISFGVSCLGVIYITLIIPTNIQFFIFGSLTIIVGLLAFVFFVHWMGVKWIERNQ
jgi:hypothetical protein